MWDHIPPFLASASERADHLLWGHPKLLRAPWARTLKPLGSTGVPEDRTRRKDFGLITSSDQAKDHPSLVVQMTRDASGVITSIDDSIAELLGWSPEELLGSPSTTLIHPVDQPSAVAAWMDMIMSPGSSHIWRGRYKTAEDSWRWVETENQARDGEPQIVVSSMRAADPEAASLEERLQAREHLLAQLSDALPVGVFHVDLDGRVTLTNQNFHLIVGVGIREVFAEQMSTVDPEYWPTLEQTLSKAFDGQRVDGVAIHIRVPTSDAPALTADRVCLLSLRPLTDGAGVVSGVVGCLSDVTEQAVLHQELEIKASVDQLTSCLNRATTIELLERTTNGSPHIPGRAVIFVDLDGLKAVNDHLATPPVISSLLLRRTRSGPPCGTEILSAASAGTNSWPSARMSSVPLRRWRSPRGSRPL